MLVSILAGAFLGAFVAAFVVVSHECGDVPFAATIVLMLATILMGLCLNISTIPMYLSAIATYTLISFL
jgi:hypothetical protein